MHSVVSRATRARTLPHLFIETGMMNAKHRRYLSLVQDTENEQDGENEHDRHPDDPTDDVGKDEKVAHAIGPFLCTYELLVAFHDANATAVMVGNDRCNDEEAQH